MFVEIRNKKNDPVGVIRISKSEIPSSAGLTAEPRNKKMPTPSMLHFLGET